MAVYRGKNWNEHCGDPIQRPQTMDLSVIIVNWNVKQYLHDCLLSIFKMFTDVSFEIIVIDNASTDNSVEDLSKTFAKENVRFIQSQVNLGFAGGNKVGVDAAKGRNVLFLNPDTIIINSGIRSLVDCIDQDESIGILGCRVLNDDLSVQKQCMRHFPSLKTRSFDSLLMANYVKFLHGTGEYYKHEDYSRYRECESISGCFMLVKGSVLERIGSFSTEYFMYAEDIDLCIRARKNGYRVVFSPNMTIIHFGGKSSELYSESHFSVVEKLKANQVLFQRLHGRGRGVLHRMIIAAGSINRILLAMAGFRPNEGAFGAFVNKHLRIISWSMRSR